MVTPDPISEWSQDEISSWINGLDIGLDRYKESLKYLTGDQLLTAKYTDLYQYGIDKGSVQTFCQKKWEDSDFLPKKVKFSIFFFNFFTVGVHQKWAVDGHQL